MIGLEVADDRFDGLASLEVLGQGFELAPVNDLDVGVVLIHPVFANGRAEAADLAGIAGPAALIVGLISAAVALVGTALRPRASPWLTKNDER